MRKTFLFFVARFKWKQHKTKTKYTVSVDIEKKKDPENDK